MASMLLTVLHAGGLLCAVVIVPFILVRLVARHLDAVATATGTGVAIMGLNTAAPILLSLLKAPLTSTHLALFHLATGGLLLAGMRMAKRAWLPEDRNGFGMMAGLWAGFAVLVLPLTHLAGIDTYKWQDLATAVAVDARIPWFISPGALFGFAPRAYPSAHPLLLASVQTMGHLGVDAGFYAVSLISGFTGIAAATLLGRQYFGASGARWLPLLYCLSPVFMRYNHWATGRGFALALLPLFAFLLGTRFSLRHTLTLATTGLLLALSHKAGLVACLALPIPYVIARYTPDRYLRIATVVLILPALLLAIALAMPWLLPGPLGLPLGAAKATLTRLGILAPLAIAGFLVVLREDRFAPLRPWLPVTLLLLPLAFTPDMYGTMILLAPTALLACAGWIHIAGHSHTRPWPLNTAIMGLLLVGATAIVAHRSLQATPHRVWKAAIFLDQYDPEGPFQIEAPGRIRPQMQAYARGCPRFSLQGDTRSKLVPPPPFDRSAPASHQLREWTGWLRHWLTPKEADISWYGENARIYHVTRDAEPKPPRESRRIYSTDGIEIFEPNGQHH